MPTFCPHCSLRLDEYGLGHEPSCPEVRAPAPAPRRDLALPKADLPRRLGGGGLEFATFFALELVGAALTPFTFALSGVLSGLLAALYMGVKDLNAGQYSVGKNVARVRIVDAKTGRPATNQQVVLRNSYYIAGWLLAILPDPIGMLGWALVAFGILVDTLMIVADPQGRRLGDRIAGTQVVPVQDQG